MNLNRTSSKRNKEKEYELSLWGIQQYWTPLLLLCEIIEIIKAKHLRLVIVGSITVDCSNGEIDPMTNAFIQMSGVFAELELRIIRERVRSGMANAKAKGAKIGRPQATADDIPANFLRHYPAFKNKQLNVSELARVCDLSRTTVYKYLNLLEG